MSEAPPSPAPPEPPRRVLREVLLVFAASVVGCLGFMGLGIVIPFVKTNIHAFVALLFLFLPAWALGRRGEALEDRGLHLRGALRVLGWAGLAAAITFPPYAVAHHYWQTEVWKRPLRFAWTNYSALPEACQGAPEARASQRAAEREGPSALTIACEHDEVRLSWRGELSVEIEGPRLRIRTEGGARAEGGGEGRTWRISGRDGGAAIELVPGADARITAKREGALLDGRSIEVGRRAHRAGENPVTYGRGVLWILELLFAQLLAVALPEEVFYRGYVQGRLAEALPQRVRLLGAEVPWLAILATSALFGLGHFLLDLDPQRLAVFFPSLLFGYLRARGESLAGCVAYHAGCNVLVRLLAVHY